MNHTIYICQNPNVTADELENIAKDNAISICDNIEKNAPQHANRLLYCTIYAYLYNMLLLAHPHIITSTRAAQLEEFLGQMLAISGIKIDAIISFTHEH